MKIKHVAGIRLAAGGTFQEERNLPVGIRVLGQIIKNYERVLPVVHEPLAHRSAGEGGDVLRGGGIGGGRGDDDCVFQGIVRFERSDHAGDIRILLPDPDVDRVERTEIRIPAFFPGPVDDGLVDDRIHRDGGFAGRAVADDQLALSAANRNHRVNRHDAGLHWLVDPAALDDAGCDFFHRIEFRGLDRSLSVERLAEGIDDAAEEALADRNLQQLAGGFDLRAFGDRGVVAKDDHADFGVFQVERQAVDAAGKFQHLIEHRSAETFDARDAVTDFADDTDIGFAGGRGFDGADFFFEFEDDIAHGAFR